MMVRECSSLAQAPAPSQGKVEQGPPMPRPWGGMLGLGKPPASLQKVRGPMAHIGEAEL